MQGENKTDKAGQLGRTVRRPGWLLAFSIMVRALHQVGAAVFLCIFLSGKIDLFSDWYMYLAVLSGIVLLAAEAMRHRQIYREVSGIVTVFKCLLLGVAIHGMLPVGPTVLLAFLIASVGAHAPKNIRHRLLV